MDDKQDCFNRLAPPKHPFPWKEIRLQNQEHDAHTLVRAVGSWRDAISLLNREGYFSCAGQLKILTNLKIDDSVINGIISQALADQLKKNP